MVAEKEKKLQPKAKNASNTHNEYRKSSNRSPTPASIIVQSSQTPGL